MEKAIAAMAAAQQITKKVFRDVPDFLSPSLPFAQKAAQGKIIVITGGGTGIGLVRSL
jgi:hypothetical protein